LKIEGEDEFDAAEIDRDLIAERLKTDAVSEYLILRNQSNKSVLCC